jgi:hypothetical protein
MAPVLSQMNPFLGLTSYSININFNIFLFIIYNIPSDFCTEEYCACLLHLVSSTCPVHLIVLDMTAIIISHIEYKCGPR